MKTLTDYLFESVDNITEMIVEANGDLQFLLLSYDDAIKYFDEYKIFNNKTIIKSGLTKDDIEKLYKYADEYSMPCPIVANYQRKGGKFVFRRWVAKLNDSLDIDVYKNAGPYQGLHNTNLKEDGKYFPSSEDFEYVIAYAHNKNTMNMPDPDNIEFVSKKQMESDSKLEQLMTFYVKNEESCLRMIEPLKGINSELYKLPNINATSKSWHELGDYKRYSKSPDKTPKTDVISANGKYKLSLKKASGAQLMSGAECESRATMMACIDTINNENDKELLHNLLKDNWYKPTKDGRTISQKLADGDQELLNAKASIKTMTATINDIISRNPDFKRALMYEAATGEIKFGKNSPAAANYILVWDDVTNNNHLYTIDEYLDHCYNSARFSFDFKTSNNSSNLSFRINVK